MKPKRRVFCPDCGRHKMLFNSLPEANLAIERLGPEILKENGYTVTEAYKCPVCLGWHLRHKKRTKKRERNPDIEARKHLNFIYGHIDAAIKMIKDGGRKREDVRTELIKAVFGIWSLEHTPYKWCRPNLRCLLKYFAAQLLREVQEKYDNSSREYFISDELKEYFFDKWEYIKEFFKGILVPIPENEVPDIPRKRYLLNHRESFSEEDIENYSKAIKNLKRAFMYRLIGNMKYSQNNLDEFFKHRDLIFDISLKTDLDYIDE